MNTAATDASHAALPAQHQASPDDHDFEPVPGLPERLPAQERMLWQGAPDWRRLALDALHLRALSIYFALLLAWRAIDRHAGGADLSQSLLSALWLLPLALAALGLLAMLARLMARTTLYTITNRRVVMRIGIVLTVSFNLPFARIASAALHCRADGSGDIALALLPPDRIGLAHLWPHARPWRFTRTEPMLRALPDARAVSALLAHALAEHAGLPHAGLAAVPPARPAVLPTAPDERRPRGVRRPHADAPTQVQGA